MAVRSTLSVIERIEAFVSPEPMSGCWLWIAYVDKKTGYARLNVEGKARNAHRLAYENVIGQIPKGLDLDHLCRVRCCVNPHHLEPVTRRINTLRGSAGDQNRAKTHCPQGHEYTIDNTYRHGAKRHCKTCVVERSKEKK